MNKFFSADSLNEIQRNISASLTNTFQMMFQLNVLMLPKLSTLDDTDLISSYMDFSYKQTKAVLSIGIGNDLVKHMAHQIDPNMEVPSPEIIQDIVCEVTNIVGNHLRTHVFNKFNIDLTLSLPRRGIVSDACIEAINLHFRIREHDSVKLVFAYPPSHKLAAS